MLAYACTSPLHLSLLALRHFIRAQKSCDPPLHRSGSNDKSAAGGWGVYKRRALTTLRDSKAEASGIDCLTVLFDSKRSVRQEEDLTKVGGRRRCPPTSRSLFSSFVSLFLRLYGVLKRFSCGASASSRTRLRHSPPALKGRSLSNFFCLGGGDGGRA